MPPLDAENHAGELAPAQSAPPESPSPRWGGVRGGGKPDAQRSTIPPSLSLPQKGGGDPEGGRPTRSSSDGDSSVVAGESLANPDGPIWHSGGFHRDTCVKADATSILPDAPVLLPKKRWLAERDQLVGRNTPLGLIIAAGERVDDIAADLSRFALIALDFPKFSDGRAFSTARLLREKHGYTGELRAIGNVLSDQIPLMRRVGFDSFEVTHGPTRSALAEGRIAEVTLHYQPAVTPEPPAGTRPWLRRTPQ